MHRVKVCWLNNNPVTSFQNRMHAIADHKKAERTAEGSRLLTDKGRNGFTSIHLSQRSQFEIPFCGDVISYLTTQQPTKTIAILPHPSPPVKNVPASRQRQLLNFLEIGVYNFSLLSTPYPHPLFPNPFLHPSPAHAIILPSNNQGVLNAERAQNIADTLVALRREVHRHPELGFQEHRTAQLVAEAAGRAGHRRPDRRGQDRRRRRPWR